VQDVDVPLTADAIGALLSRRDIYRRTAFLVLRNHGDTALVAVRPGDPDALFSPVAGLRVVSGPQATAWIEDPSADVSNASALAAAALARRRDGVLGYVVQGRFEHVNFIWRPAPLTVRVTEVVPPHPPKLLAMAEQAVGFDEDLPPVTLIPDTVDVRDLMADHPAPHYLLPCRGSGVASGGEVSFLDCHPEPRPDWLLIGCDRSAQFCEHFYGAQPRRIDLCPRARAGAAAPPGERLLTKCCLLERDAAPAAKRAGSRSGSACAIACSHCMPRSRRSPPRPATGPPSTRARCGRTPPTCSPRSRRRSGTTWAVSPSRRSGTCTGSRPPTAPRTSARPARAPRAAAGRGD
jgi:hypothetical protein